MNADGSGSLNLTANTAEDWMCWIGSPSKRHRLRLLLHLHLRLHNHHPHLHPRCAASSRESARAPARRREAETATEGLRSGTDSPGSLPVESAG